MNMGRSERRCGKNQEHTADGGLQKADDELGGALEELEKQPSHVQEAYEM